MNDIIAAFLRDGQYRIAELSIELNVLRDDGSQEHNSLIEKRELIATLMDMLYEGCWLITSGYNHVQVGTGLTWSERELQAEIEYVRYETNMNEMPGINFTPHYPQIVQIITGGGTGSGGSLPSGNFGQFLMYDINGQLIPIDISPYGGWSVTDSITQYFNR